MARRSTGPRKNINSLSGNDLTRQVGVTLPRAARLATLEWVAILGFLTASLYFGGSRSAAAAQDKTQTPTTKVDWGVFLPEGEGKAEVALSCASCHDLSQVITQKKSGDNWSSTVRKMISAYQAPVDKDDFQVIVDYLSKNFGDKNPIEHLPMNINTSPLEALARLPGINLETARAIVESRETVGLFSSVEDLMRVKRVDAAALKKIEAYIKTKE